MRSALIAAFGLLAVLVGALAVPGSLFTATVAAQDANPKIWTGVYSKPQAERGKVRFLSDCATCHNFDLQGQGTRGPALTGAPFMTNWDTQELKSLFAKIQRMPLNNPASLPDAVYMDIMTYILQVNAFPEGDRDLSAEALEGIHIVRKDTGKLVTNFAIVEMVGCLTQRPDNRWVLTSAGEPVVSRDQPLTSDELKKAAAKPLGHDQFLLVSVLAFKPNAYQGHKVSAKGLFYKAPSENRLNVTSLQPVAPSCAD
jgi:S-disulfanyl-L-cysteine oxidoreductase SoxD